METTTPNLEDRHTRYRDLIAPSVLSQTVALVIGCGAIGAAVARQAAQMGVGRLWLFDGEDVDAVNLGPQGYPPSSIGQPKVNALATDCLHLNPDCTPYAIGRPFTIRTFRAFVVDLIEPSDRVPVLDNTVVFMCVDSLATRSTLVSEITDSHDLPIIDARMNAMQARILTVADHPGNPLDPEAYEATIDRSLDTRPESCTGRSSNWTAVMAAAFMISQMVKLRTGVEVHGDFTVSMSSCMITKPSG